MRIYSPFQDYYDSVLNLFQDEIVPVYKRKTKVISNALDFIDIYNYHYGCVPGNLRKNYEKITHDINYVELIGFAGRIYPYVEVNTEDHSDIHHTKRIRMFIYDHTELDNKYKFDNSWYRYSYKTNFEYLINMKEIKDLFEIYKVPIFRIYKKHDKYILELNPQLKPFKFQGVLDPYTALQELHMYLNNVMVMDTQVDVPVGSDEDIRDCKGFYKYSFKNTPGTKKRKKDGKNRK